MRYSINLPPISGKYPSRLSSSTSPGLAEAVAQTYGLHEDDITCRETDDGDLLLLAGGKEVGTVVVEFRS